MVKKTDPNLLDWAQAAKRSEALFAEACRCRSQFWWLRVRREDARDAAILWTVLTVLLLWRAWEAWP